MLCAGIISLLVWTSCRKDFEDISNIGRVEFSTDTLYLDTIFTNTSSATYSMRVYNRTDEDITIPSIRLERGETSNFRLNIDGIAGKSFQNIKVLAKDSIFVFAEVTTDIKEFSATADEFLYTDKLLFDTGESTPQDVDMITLVKDAIFLFPDRDDVTQELEFLCLGENPDGNCPDLVDECGNTVDRKLPGFFLTDDQLTFTREKPYVIFGYAAIPGNRTLTIEAGARIHFHENSGIIAANTATLKIQGELSDDPADPEKNLVILEGDRLESDPDGLDFSDIAGQWGSVWLTAGSRGHEIKNTIIKNASAALIVDAGSDQAEPMLTLNNVQIYNSGNIGLVARNSFVRGENVVVHDAGLAAVNLALGGKYEFTHCTFTNYWDRGNRNFPALLIDNGLFNKFGQLVDATNLVQADFTNCIIYGNRQLEVQFRRVRGPEFNFAFKNCLIRFDPSPSTELPVNDQDLYDFESDRYTSLIRNEDPDFKDVRENQVWIGEESAANGKAMTPGAGADILGTMRNVDAPDIGAYESRDLEEEVK